MTRAPLVFVAALAGATLLGGCVADLGTCDEAAAKRLVYTNDVEGLPAYEGQALVIASCGNGAFCHSEVAPDQLFGVPAGLSFDVRVASTDHDLERLRRAHATVRDRAERMWDAIDDDRMPPSGVGDDVRKLGRAYRGLPEFDTAEGRAIVRNWLACGAPVVERVADDRPAGAAPVGDVVAASPGSDAGCGAVGMLCGAHCASVLDDAARCGDCATPCSVGGVCVDGACGTCSVGLVLCDGACVDPGSDAAHCGSCDTACGAGERCAAGACTTAACGGGTTECAGGCVDTQTSPFHCGGCDAPCDPGETCVAGTCDCGETDSDPFDCGTCGNVCPAGAECEAGACVCESPLVPCGGACVDTDSDEANCGACGVPCTGTDRCVEGVCSPCGTGISFASDVLGLFDGGCVGSLCHGGSDPAAGLALDVERAYDALVGVPSRCEPDHALVEPFEPEESHLLEKVRGTDDCAHSRMPLGFPPLAPEDIEVLESWICAGAPRD